MEISDILNTLLGADNIVFVSFGVASLGAIYATLDEYVRDKIKEKYAKTDYKK